MSLQEKINKRIEELEKAIQELDSDKEIDWKEYTITKLALTMQCIRDIKQLNN